MNPISRFVRWLNKTLELGYARQVYIDLYSAGALTQTQFLLLMDEMDKKFTVGDNRKS